MEMYLRTHFPPFEGAGGNDLSCPHSLAFLDWILVKKFQSMKNLKPHHLNTFSNVAVYS